MLHVKLIQNFDELTNLENKWNELTTGVPFRQWQWLHVWWKHYHMNRDQSTELFTLAVFDENEQLVAVAPWYLDQAAGQTLKMLGTGEVCTDYTSLLLLPEKRESAIESLADFLIDKVMDRWNVIQLDAIAENDPNIRALLALLENRDCMIHEQPALNTWRLALPESWDEFLASVSKSHRKQLRRLQNRVLQTDRAKLHCASTKDEFEQAWSVFVDLHQRRRQSLNEPGCFSSAEFSAFHQDSAAQMLTAGKLRLYWLEVDDEPVAAEYQLAGSDCMYAYQAGVNPDRLDLEPGRLITVATLQKAIEQGYESFDFLRGDEPYKAHFRATSLKNFTYRVIAPKRIAKVKHHVWLASEKIKSFAKRQLSATGFYQEPTSKSKQSKK